MPRYPKSISLNEEQEKLYQDLKKLMPDISQTDIFVYGTSHLLEKAKKTLNTQIN